MLGLQSKKTMSKKTNQKFYSVYSFSFWFSQIGFGLLKIDNA
jgi:hypothetical protein